MITNFRIMLKRTEKKLLWITEEQESRNDYKAVNLKKRKSVLFDCDQN